MPISEADLAAVPEPVARYLRRAGVVGRTRVQNVRLRQRGTFRMSEKGGWAAMAAEQRYTVQPPAFVWRATIAAFLLAQVKVTDGFADGHGWLAAKLFGLFSVADARGPEVDQGELLRFMTEIVWFPTAWLSGYITWQPVDARSVKATIDHQGITASAILTFDEQDRMAAIEAQRFRMVGARYSLDTWVIELARYEEHSGLLIPTAGRALWKLPAGDYDYFKGEITDLEYDTPAAAAGGSISGTAPRSAAR